MSTHRPFDDLVDLIKQLTSLDSDNGPASLTAKTNYVVKQTDISHLMVWLAHIQKASRAKLDESHICILVSSYSGQDDIKQLKEFIDNASKGKEPVSKLCKERGVGLRVLEMAPDVPHIVSEKWPENQCMAAAGFGMEAAAAGGDILGLASLAPGSEQHCERFCDLVINDKKHNFINLSENSAFALAILNLMKNKTGREVAAMLGAMVAARSRGLPVLIEGWSAISALCVLKSIAPEFTNHVRVASVENAGQAVILESIDEHPVIGGFVNLGPGCGIALAHSLMASMLNLSD